MSDSPDDNLEVEAGDSAVSDEAVADLGDEAGELSEDEKLPEETAATDANANPDALTDEGAAPADPATQEPTPEPVAEAAAPETSEAPAEAPAEETAAATPTPEPSENPSDVAAAAATTGGGGATLKKIKAAPEQFGKKWLNAVYVAREGDDPKVMSQKIYGSEDHAKQICKWNSYNCGRGIKVGDKIYYNSPKRPDDDQNLKTFYEDAGVPAETYVAKEGDNIKAVGKQLLGNDRSWIELWVTNPDVESKGALPEGTQLKYWPATETAAPTQSMAQNETAPPADEMQIAENSEEAAAGAPPPPPTEEMAPPPSDLPPQQDMAAQGSVAPPPPAEMAPPPPPPPPMPEPRHTTPAAAEMTDDPNQTMALGGAAILMLGAVVLIISIRKKRRNKIDYNTATHTQIDG